LAEGNIQFIVFLGFSDATGSIVCSQQIVFSGLRNIWWLGLQFTKLCEELLSEIKFQEGESHPRLLMEIWLIKYYSGKTSFVRF
jgi:hypothetical protein